MTSTPDATTSSPTSRRDLMLGGAFGAAAAALLAACGGGSSSPVGQSGDAPRTTLVAPTVPLREPSAADLENDVTLLRTATSLELLAAEIYGTYGSRLGNAEWAGHAERFAADHGTAAEDFAAATPADARITEANEVVRENSVDPVIDTLQSDAAILNLFAGVERTLATTYMVAVGTFSDREGRANFAGLAAAAARRAALLGDGGAGEAPTGPLFPTTDLIAGDAYLSREAEMAAEEPAEGEDAAE